MIQACHLKKSYRGGETEVLKGIDLKVGTGEFAVVLGASGCGKSTLLNVLSGLERPDEGQILYDGLDLAGLTERQLTRFRRENVGFIFQQYYLLPHLTVAQNVRMGADLAGNRDYQAAIAAVGLEDKRNKYPGQLSGGEQQRTAIARAIAKRPKILYLDEPTGALDEQTGRQTLDYLCRLHREQSFTMIMVTHNQNIAQTANLVIRMNSGRISQMQANPTVKTAYKIGW